MATHGGRYDFDDGGTYLGTWEEGKAHGYGVCTGPKGLGDFSGLWQVGFESSGVYSWPSGNTYEGQWQNGKRHGLGMETKGKWIYRGEWSMGFKGRHGVRHASGTGAKYEGGYTSGIQEGYGVETYADGGYYSGQFNRGCRHGFGVRKSPPFSVLAQFLKDKTIRASLTSLRSVEETEEVVKQREKHLEEVHGGFVLMTIQPSQMLIDAHLLLARKARKAADPANQTGRKPLFSKLRRQHSVTDLRHAKQKEKDADNFKTASVRSANAHAGGDAQNNVNVNNVQMQMQRRPTNAHAHGRYVPGHNHKPQLDQTLEPDTYVDPNVVEIYSGQWKADKRTGYGVCERSDGLKFEGELFNNVRHGFGMTTFANGMQECGRYKNNVLTEWSDAGRGRLGVAMGMAMFGRSSKLRDKVDDAVKQARGAAQMAVQISDVARSIQNMARQKADAADQAAAKARLDKDIAKKKAAEFLLIYPDKRAASKDKKDKFSLIPPVQAALSSAMGCALNPGDEGRLYSSARGNQASVHRGTDSQSAGLDRDRDRDPNATALLSLSSLLGNTHEISSNEQPQPQPQTSDNGDGEGEGDGREQRPESSASGTIVNDLFSHYASLKDSCSSNASTCTASTAISNRSRTTTVSNAPSTASSGYGSATLQRSDSTEADTPNAPTSGSGPSAAKTKTETTNSASLRRASYSNSPVANGHMLNGRPSRLLIQVSKLAQQTEESDSDQERDLSVDRASTVSMGAGWTVGRSPVRTILNDRSLPLNHVVKRSTDCKHAEAENATAGNDKEKEKEKERNRSIPDLHTCESLKQFVMPREEAYRLGHARRQQLIEERLRNGEVIVIRVGLLKRWLVRHIVVFVAFLLNLALIFWLASLLPNDSSSDGSDGEGNNSTPSPSPPPPPPDVSQPHDIAQRDEG